jgi:CHAD domain-containing protein
MPYRLQPGESVSGALCRSAREQLDHAISELSDGVEVDTVTAIHDARKALKKERSLLRLCRGALPAAERRRENRTFRDAAHGLGAARDADVMRETLDELGDRYAGQVPTATFDAVRGPLEAERTTARRLLEQGDATEQVSAELRDAVLRIDEWPLERDGWRAVADGLSREYVRGRRAYTRARARPTDENLHAWRKRAKDLWYHLRWLGPISPRTMRGHAEDAHRLADLLGDDHDLAVLRSTLIELAGRIPQDLDPVLGLLEHRRAQLQTEAMFLGERLYAEKPKAFVHRLHRYWQAWRDETRSAAEHRPAELAEAAGG